ncbi:MAG: hypothetical protein KC777_07445 [Cyanobacteria bacterium HKST-UBA02]|nr:hypothetical protein [Cyanobacteria bacterium HKST-UBA02]
MDSLDDLILAFRCPVKFESMAGDDVTRFCQKCSLNVHNLSARSRREASHLLESGDICVHFEVDPSGRIRTDDTGLLFTLSQGFRNFHSRLVVYSSLFLAFLTASSLPARAEPSADEQPLAAKKSNVKKPPGAAFPFDCHQFDCVDGMPVRGEIFDAVMDLVPRFGPLDKPIVDQSERQVIDNFADRIQTKRVIDRQDLGRVKHFYKQRGDVIKEFQARTLEALIEMKSPGPQLDKDVMLAEFERARHRAMSALIGKAEEELKKGDLEAARAVHDFVRVGIAAQSFETYHPKLLEGVRYWTLDDYGHRGFSLIDVNLVCDESMLDRAIRVQEKVVSLGAGTERDKAGQVGLLKTFKLAKVLAALKSDRDNKALEKKKWELVRIIRLSRRGIVE